MPLTTDGSTEVCVSLKDITLHYAPLDARAKYALEVLSIIEKKHFNDLRPWYSVQVGKIVSCQKPSGNFQLLIERCIAQLNIDEAFPEALAILRAVRTNVAA